MYSSTNHKICVIGLGYESKLKELFDVSENDLEDKGIKARDFVLSVKNNNVQTYRVLKMCKGK